MSYAEKKALIGILSCNGGSFTFEWLVSEQVYHGNLCRGNLHNLNGVLHGDELLYQPAGSGQIGDMFGNGCVSPTPYL